MKLAIKQCRAGKEEKGGFILKEREGDQFMFIQVQNSNTGKPVAKGLYTANKSEYGVNVLKHVLWGGWEIYASFHTHPNGYSVKPSSIDLNQLFTGHKINYIYATKQKELVKYEKVAIEDDLHAIIMMGFGSPATFYTEPTDNTPLLIWTANNVKLKR